MLARAVDKTSDGKGNNVSGEYCNLNEAGKAAEDKTLMEKETEFLEAMQAYYMDGKATLSDEEFEALKEELLWSGSEVAILSSAEMKFLEATMAFNKGKNILTNDEFDRLKGQLKEEGSSVVSAGPRCSLRSKKVYSDAYPDYLKMTALNVPAAVIVLGAVFVIDKLSGFSLTNAIELPPPWSILFLWGIVFPTIYTLATSITNLVLPDALILKAECPNCGAPTQAYFGGIFNIDRSKTIEGVVECDSCKADLKYNSLRREVVMDKSPDEKQAEKAALVAKRKAREALGAKK